jgi:hypothetical protein
MAEHGGCRDVIDHILRRQMLGVRNERRKEFNGRLGSFGGNWDSNFSD